MISSSYSKKPLWGKLLQKKILITIGDLPLIPRIVLRVQQLLVNPNSDFEDIVKLVEADPVFTAKVLKIANSAYYGMRARVTSVQRAVVMLGYKTIGEIITVVGISKLLSKTLEGYRLESEDLWQHSMAVAFGSRIIARKEYPRLQNDAFLAGLFHDIGKIILDKYVTEKKEAFDEFIESGQHSFLSAEKKLLGFDHTEIIGELFKKWGFLKPLANAVRYHHSPFSSKAGELSYIIYVADLIVKMNKNIIRQQIDKRALEFLNLEEKDIRNIMDEAVEAVCKIKEEIFIN